jgi:hypothetical protein
VKYIVGFGRFWYDFIVGDSVVLAIGGVAVLVLGYGLVEAGASSIAQVVLPLTVAGTLWASLPALRHK